MLKLEKNIVIIAAGLLLTMFALVAYSIFGLGIRLPGCVTTASSFDKGEILQKSENLLEIHMMAKMWAFEPQLIKVKPNTTLDIYLASKDVNHGFHLENTNVNLMAVPGAINYARVTLREPGVYHIVCHEYCGAGHQNMSAAIVVGDDSEQSFLLSQMDKSLTGGTQLTEGGAGKTLFSSKGCVACHSLDGSRGAGPTFKGLYGRKEKMSDGKIITVDDDYIVESIKDPAAKVVNGFQPVMPKLPVTDEEIKQIITYIKTL
jgi:cytochrome c oxidase subunit II